MKHTQDWGAVKVGYRLGVSKVLTDIRNGTVTEEDLARLENFCRVSLELMNKVSLPMWRKAERDTLIGAFLHNEVVDFEDLEDDLQQTPNR